MSPQHAGTPIPVTVGENPPTNAWVTDTLSNPSNQWSLTDRDYYELRAVSDVGTKDIPPPIKAYALDRDGQLWEVSPAINGANPIIATEPASASDVPTDPAQILGTKTPILSGISGAVAIYLHAGGPGPYPTITMSAVNQS